MNAKRINITSSLSPEVHARFEVWCAQQNRSKRGALRQMVEDAVRGIRAPPPGDEPDEPEIEEEVEPPPYDPLNHWKMCLEGGQTARDTRGWVEARCQALGVEVPEVLRTNALWVEAGKADKPPGDGSETI